MNTLLSPKPSFLSIIASMLCAVGCMTAAEPDHASNRPMRTRETLAVTVGESEADFRGSDDKVIQGAIEYVNRSGGGSVRLMPGRYRLHNAIYLRPHILLEGSGDTTILEKADGVITPLTRDADWYEYGIRVKDVTGFARGGGIMLRSGTNVPDYAIDVWRATITALNDDVIFLDRVPQKNFWIEKGATAAAIFPLIAGDHVDEVTIKNLVLDGRRDRNAHINGNFSGAVFLEFCNRCKFEGVTARNYNGDGFSAQVCDDIEFTNCQAINNADLGFHPGSGTQRPVFENCKAIGNSQGLYFCWGVSDGKAENCVLSDNKMFGVNIGHRDTDNVVRGCTIERNGEIGVLFRNEGGEFRNGHRNRVERCIIRDTGSEKPGIGIEIQGPTDDIVLTGLTLENTPAGKQKTGIRIAKEAQRIQLERITIRGSPTQIEDLRQISKGR